MELYQEVLGLIKSTQMYLRQDFSKHQLPFLLESTYESMFSCAIVLKEREATGGDRR